MLVGLIFAGLPLGSIPDGHTLIDFIDRLLVPATQRHSSSQPSGDSARHHASCSAWLVWLKAGPGILAYRDRHRRLRILFCPFVSFIAVMMRLTS